MRLTAFTDYCLRTLIYVAVNGDDLATIDQIASHFGINRNHLVKVVFRLGQLGYLQTSRGKGGGIRLASDASKLSLGKLVRQTEQDFALVECFPGRDCLCVIEPACVLKNALLVALEAFFAVLDEYTIADLAKPSRDLAQLLAVPAVQ
jgi:Rrf2 family transcriptional regulator, nitric oxide-sensitive transcriptional repressor